MKRYRYKLLKGRRYINDALLNIAYIYDMDTQKPIYFIDVYKDLKKEHQWNLVFAGEFEADRIPGEYYGLSYIDAALCNLFFENNKSIGEVISIRELGHYLLGHYDIYKTVDGTDIEKSEEQIRKEDIEADEFAVTETSAKKVLDYLDILFPNDIERREHVLEIAKKMRNSKNVRIKA